MGRSSDSLAVPVIAMGGTPGGSTTEFACVKDERRKSVNELFEEKVVTDRRTYFLDVKETREGSMYLVIGELAQVGNDTARHRVMIFEENIDLFLKALQKSVAHIRRARQRPPLELEADFDTKEPPVGGAKGGKPMRELLGHIGLGLAKREQVDDDDQSIKATLKRIESSLAEIRKHFK